MLRDSVFLLKYFRRDHLSFHRFALLFGLTLCFFGTAESINLFTLPEKLLKSAESQYGDYAKRRLLAWQTLIRDNSTASDMEKLEKTNKFFNQMQFIDDIIQWRKEDYWATPVEFISTGGGDCEDFSLAKYFTLKALGVAENKLNMTYVKAVQLNQAHMVVTYYPTPDAIPLILDNLVADIQSATNRKDLLPVYSFNGLGLWLAKSRGKGKKVGGSDRLKRWQDLLSRMPDGLN
jgi:predicted transglutaminase-like cysteine proteinase